MSETTAFSRFFREASHAERREVFEKVIEEACRMQMEKAYQFAKLMAGRGSDTKGG